MLVDATRRNNYDPHPARLRFASAVDPPHKGEGRLGLEPSREQPSPPLALIQISRDPLF